MSTSRKYVEGVPGLPEILSDTSHLGFEMSSDPEVSAVLQALAASKPGGRLLELGTGTGVGTASLLSGMDADARLITVENDPQALKVAQRHLSRDERVTFRLEDGASFLQDCTEGPFDLIFADTWPGKLYGLDQALSLVAVGGIYFVDDLLPNPSWEHADKVASLVQDLHSRADFVPLEIPWASGLMLLVRSPE